MIAVADEITLLCEKIDMPSEALNHVLDILSDFDFTSFYPHIEKLNDITTAKEGYEQICLLLEESPDKGYIQLTIYLMTALKTKEIYSQKSIDEVIFYDTIASLSRCVNEHLVSFGKYGYDRAFWNYRQIAMSIFRIGTLEYEMVTFDGEDALLEGEVIIKKGDNIISIHIPSDAVLTPQNCKSSLKSAKEFFKKFYPDFSYHVFYCGSWIISPNLKQVLPESSNIIAFLNNFEIYRVNHEGEGYKSWVFKNQDLTPDLFPQNTSLQRNITAHIKQGGKIGEGYGVIRKESL